MGAGYGDVDGNGQIDIYLANGGPIMSAFNDALFLKPGQLRRSGRASQRSQSGKGHGVAFADYDQDGDLDVYVGPQGHYLRSLADSLYRNNAFPELCSLSS